MTGERQVPFFCPYCGEALGAEEATTAACVACGRRFSVLGNDVRP